MRRFARGESYDEQAMRELDSEALGLRVASELFATVSLHGERAQPAGFYVRQRGCEYYGTDHDFLTNTVVCHVFSVISYLCWRCVWTE